MDASGFQLDRGAAGDDHGQGEAWKRAGFIIFEAAEGYTSNVPISEAQKDNVLIAHRFFGEELPRDHGAPVRGLIPDRDFYKSAKWLEAINVTVRDEPGVWESSGYTVTGDGHGDYHLWRPGPFLAEPELTRGSTAFCRIGFIFSVNMEGSSGGIVEDQINLQVEQIGRAEENGFLQHCGMLVKQVRPWPLTAAAA